MGNRSWNILLRNAGPARCSLRGWPRVVIRGASGRVVTSRISDVRFTNLGPVPVRRIVIRPGGAAVVTVTGSARPRGCVSRWSLRLAIGGTGGPVTVREPAGAAPPCAGGRFSLSPFYSMRRLRGAIKMLRVSPIPAPVPAARNRDVQACRPAMVGGRVGFADTTTAGSLIVLRVHASGAACTLAGSWPTVRLNEQDGASPVAKAFPDTQAFSAASKVLADYGHGGAVRTAVELRPHSSASIAMLAAGTSPCHHVTAATIYPGARAVGAGRKVMLARPLRVCGLPRILTFLPAGPAAVGIGRRALAAAASGNSGVRPSRWWYGTDSAFPFACGTSPPYREPSGVCAAGTHGDYGAYIGEIGSFQSWQGCGSGGLNWLPGNYDAAQVNAILGHGLGAAVYWFAAGPGRDPRYNGTMSRAHAWGVAQARRLARVGLGNAYYLPYVVMDVENNGAPPDGNGWNSVWNGPCGGVVRRSYIPPGVDLATVVGFDSYIEDNTSYFPLVYSAGIAGYGSWGGIFGTRTQTDTPEWTFANETSSVAKFPLHWSVDGVRAVFFFHAPARCQLMWQWSGGNGVLNRFGGDFDQVDGRHLGACPQP